MEKKKCTLETIRNSWLLIVITNKQDNFERK